MFANDLQTCGDAIIPVITKCNPNDYESNDIDDLKSSAVEILQAELEDEQRRIKKEVEKIKSMYNESPYQSNRYRTKFDIDFENTKDFFEKFSESMVIYDPLDRDIIDQEGQLSNSTREELREMIKNLKKVPTAKVEIRAPLTT